MRNFVVFIALLLCAALSGCATLGPDGYPTTVTSLRCPDGYSHFTPGFPLPAVWTCFRKPTSSEVKHEN